MDDAWTKMIQDSYGKPWIEVEEVPEGEDLYLDGCNVIIIRDAGSTMVLAGLEGKSYLELALVVVV